MKKTIALTVLGLAFAQQSFASFTCNGENGSSLTIQDTNPNAVIVTLNNGASTEIFSGTTPQPHSYSLTDASGKPATVQISFVTQHGGGCKRCGDTAYTNTYANLVTASGADLTLHLLLLMNTLSKNLILFTLGSALLVAGLGLFAQTPQSIVIESIESKNHELGPVYNEIKWLPGKDQDVWMMNQSHFGRNPHPQQWERLAIVIDKTTSPKNRAILSIESGST